MTKKAHTIQTWAWVLFVPSALFFRYALSRNDMEWPTLTNPAILANQQFKTKYVLHPFSYPLSFINIRVPAIKGSHKYRRDYIVIRIKCQQDSVTKARFAALLLHTLLDEKLI